jgi:hypothetical protein
LLNNQQSAESLTMNLIDDGSGKENQHVNRYEQENQKLRIMNE